jgi:hypothetical protein
MKHKRMMENDKIDGERAKSRCWRRENGDWGGEISEGEETKVENNTGG